MSGRYFEDLAVGQPFGSGRLRVDKEQIKDSIPNHSISTKTRRCTQSSAGWRQAAGMLASSLTTIRLSFFKVASVFTRKDRVVQSLGADGT